MMEFLARLELRAHNLWQIEHVQLTNLAQELCDLSWNAKYSEES